MLHASFLDELTKLAASTDVLRAAAKRVGFHELRSRHLLNPWRAKDTLKDAALMAQAGRGTGISPAISTMTTAQRSVWNRRLRQMGTAPDPSVDAFIKRFASGQRAGRIATIAPEGTGAMIGAKTPEGQRAAHAVAVLHEQAERATKPRDIAPGFAAQYGHLSPGVMMKEHNMVSKMTGPGADDARQAFNALRAKTGEYPSIRHAMETLYGPRSLQFLQQGEKIPKAMRKDLLRRVRGDLAANGVR